ncbi:uncharacterized protein CCOS01_17007 [Colletotrichum costaricense]|uniref:Uncharacterized protein n=1 Tax=Colletotrichum costaricense TaxID=1209916 RepID=A0AAI9YEM1_9PEZI|nr:uncharacterized protein CCOS01_17007 [Colletotrichum costaricense]KAK1503831.1 hypothetical protein CCOS01_17007 [Colletotrichum costaricense]
MLPHPPVPTTMGFQQAQRQDPPAILDRLAFLPLELQKHILYDYLTVSSSPCILSLFVPDWAVCARAADPVNEIYDLQRIDVYTKSASVSGGGGGSVRGKYESGVRHGYGDHASFPLMRQVNGSHDQQHGTLLLEKELGRRFPAAMNWALRDLGRNGLRVFEQVWPRGHDDGVGRCMASGALVFREAGRGHGRDADYSRATGAAAPASAKSDTSSLSLPRHLMFNSVPSDPWLQLRLRRNAVTDFRCEMAFVIERGLPDGEFIAVDWTAMTRLETLFLDLRTYASGSGGGFLQDAIRRAAVKMGCLRLRCLVIAGLRTGERYGRSQVCEWETDEQDEVDGEVNWVKVFAPALGEGGRLVFIDRRVVDVDWDAWRVRAEGEGLLARQGREGEDGSCDTGAYLKHLDRVMGGR